MLDEMAHRSIGCEFRYDKTTLSFLTFSAQAYNPRIVCANKKILGFESLNAKFSLDNIKLNEIILSEIILNKGYSNGFRPKSSTFKFIDFLAAPIDPARDYPGRWKLKLMNLRLENSSFEDQFGSAKVIASNVSLALNRTAKNNFSLRPKIGSLKIITAKNTEINLGRLHTKLSLLDGYAKIKDLKLSDQKSSWGLNGKLGYESDSQISGDVKFEITPSTFNLENLSSLKLSSNSKISGTLDKTYIKGDLKNSPTSNLDLFDHAVVINDITGDYTFLLEDDGRYLLSTSIFGAGENSSVRTTRPLTVSDQGISGSFSSNIKVLNWNGLSAKDLILDFSLSGSIDKPELDFKGTTSNLGFLNKYIENVNFEGQTSENKIKVSLSNQSNSFQAAGEILSNGKEAPSLKSFSLSATDVPLISPSGTSGLYRSPFILNAKGTLDGKLTAKDLSGSFAIQLNANTPAKNKLLAGNATLKNGILSALLRNDRGSILAEINSDLRKSLGALKISLTDFSLSEVDPRSTCSLMDGELKYEYSGDILLGSGSLKINKLSFGCDPYLLALTESQNIKIHNGSINLDHIHLRGLESDLNLNGKISVTTGMDLEAKGQVELTSLLPIVPVIDDLKGSAHVNLQISGAISQPLMTGEASLENGEIIAHSLNLTAENLSGKVKLKHGKINIEKLRGDLNGGTFRIEGKYDPYLTTETNISIIINNINITPIENFSIVASGEAFLKPKDSSNLVISGNILIERGELERNINLKSLIKSLTQRSKDAEISTTSSSSSNFDNIFLDLDISAANSLYLLANWAETELSGIAKINGTLSTPDLKGSLTALNGWFGLKERRFSISSGKVTIPSLTSEPFLELTGETQVPSLTGESILVLLEAKGPISSPIVKFSSEQGLSEREIIKLVTSSGIELSRSIYDDIYSEGSSSSSTKQSSLFYFLKNLTDIDSLSIEPTFNELSGTLEPNIVAEKNLSNKLKIVGRNSISGNTKESGVFGVFDFSPRISIMGGFQNLPLEKTTASLIDLSFTVLSSSKKVVDILFENLNAFSQSEILETLRISQSSKILKEQIPQFRKSIRKKYRDSGYLDAKVEITCQLKENFCISLLFKIQEGFLYRIKDILMEGTDPGNYFEVSNLKQFGNIASKTEMTDIEHYFTHILRRDGYIETRVKAKFEKISQENLVNLKVSINAGNPVTFIFTGNNFFKAEDFLETINLLNREQPFGKNTVNILVQNIEELYRKSGFLYATIRYSQESDESKRIYYKINIDEGQSIGVLNVRLEGNNGLETDLIRNSIKKKDKFIYQKFNKPKFAIDEELQYFSKTIEDIYNENGFPEVEINSEIRNIDESHVEIIYLIEEGKRIEISNLSVHGLNYAIELPNLPYSISKINTFIMDIDSILLNKGFFNSSISTSISNNTLEINVFQGNVTKIGAVQIIGNSSVLSKTISDIAKLVPGEILRESQLENSRRQLFGLGLFSSVEISPQDGSIDSTYENLTIKVSEKALRTLDLGLGANSAFGAHLFGEYRDREIFADGRSLGFRIDTYYDQDVARVSKGVASLKYVDPYVLSDIFRLTEDLRFQRLKNGTLPFELDRTSLSSFIDRSITEKTKLSLGHLLSFEDLSNVEPDVIISPLDTGSLRFSTLSSSLTYDQRDNAVIPTSGYYGSLDLGVSQKSIGSEANFLSAGTQFAFYYPLPLDAPLTLANNTRIAGLFGISGTDEIPLSQRFFMGGHSTVRGFRENSLGPKGSEGNVIGGDLSVLNNIELQYLLYQNIQLAAFFDIGSVFLQSQNLSTSDLRESAGIAARLLTPIGSIGIDVGFPLDQRKDESATRFHFNIGAQF